ncbi:MAG TPA: 4'-phosphopantetheinyl transferase superfamily protein [Burkholderiales bacterium]|nr:4'-phosphopantetheinyl transferase superfamily protein [Burkholderiales bacterium]
MNHPPFIDLWLLRYESVALAGGPAWFSEEEHARLASMHHPRRRLEFVLGRRLLRHALQSRYPNAFRGWRVEAPETGRPFLETEDSSPPPTFSISHCKGHVACALAPMGPIGVDVECIGTRKRDVASLSAAVLHPIEQERLAASNAVDRERLFLRFWTLKEALAKALGLGLAIPMRELAIVDDRLVHAPTEIESPDWRFHSLEKDALWVALAWKNADAAPHLRVNCVEAQNLRG